MFVVGQTYYLACANGKIKKVVYLHGPRANSMFEHVVFPVDREFKCGVNTADLFLTEAEAVNAAFEKANLRIKLDIDYVDLVLLGKLEAEVNWFRYRIESHRLRSLNSLIVRLYVGQP